MTPFARWLFIILFVLCGFSLIIYALISLKKADTQKEETETNNPDSLK